MERGLILLVAALMVYVASGVQGTSHLSFANNTQVNITRAGCGVTKLCVETPDYCDPTGNNSCLFSSVGASAPLAPNGIDLSFELRGDSMGYIALGLTVNATEGTSLLFICAQNSSDNGTFFFRTMQRNNTDNALTAAEMTVREIQGLVKDNVIRCEFNVNVNITMTRSSYASTFSVLLGNGSIDDNELSSFNILLNRSLNLANLTSNINTTPAPTVNVTPSNVTMTPSTNTTSGSSGPVHHHAVLLLSVLTLSVKLTV